MAGRLDLAMRREGSGKESNKRKRTKREGTKREGTKRAHGQNSRVIREWGRKTHELEKFWVGSWVRGAEQGRDVNTDSLAGTCDTEGAQRPACTSVCSQTPELALSSKFLLDLSVHESAFPPLARA